ncbi:hypothetical protein RMS29_011095 [Agrobacterium rosae]|uniref:Uncharacterized protein n=1 Tax=Agrobacterium rosae TaxID=1972867 RepID=A0AAE5VQV4_9HYPH|nr:hypothetical protein [Agrobacterium rosae]KAA3513131.1 hypothetical protein DXM21_09085 [Agrobacterium rosae]KAA3521380.1 hypothetical protein DXM25_08895 [Agrobacterium rosae]MCM2432770.1 hypothetical protein [Agrobacterium rosae]MDX8328160.1 hypothetical protein [Agrobacterium rosae]MQB48275.1 hypothetical protein [Agrobacterium rosae]
MSRVPKKQDHKTYDVRDRLILALHAQLRAERETREAMEWVMRNGGLSPEVLEAMASDPIPVVTAEDMQMIDSSLKHLQLETGRGGAHS